MTDNKDSLDKMSATKKTDSGDLIKFESKTDEQNCDDIAKLDDVCQLKSTTDDSVPTSNHVYNEMITFPRVLNYDELKRQSPDTCNLRCDLDANNDIEKRCHCTLSLAIGCSNKLSEHQISSVLEVLPLLQDGIKSNDMTTCTALLLNSLTKQVIKSEQLTLLEDSVLKIANSVITDTSFDSHILDTRILSLKREYSRSAIRLCQELLSEKALDLCNVDVLTICCSSLRNFTINKAGSDYQYNEQTLKFVLGMIGKATQEIISENLDEEEDSDVLTVSSYMVDQCLIVLEHILSEDSLSHRKTLVHEDFSLLHCLTRLLGWCVSVLFCKGNESSNFVDDSLPKVYLSILVSILKILSILSFNPDQYNNFTNIKGLMEKIMICILKSFFWSDSNHFDILILALELLINFFLKNKKTFVLLCLKKFKTCDGEILCIEGLLKILSNSIDKIQEIQPRVLAENARIEEANEANEKAKNETPEAGNDSESTMNFVLEAADEDMMLSTIVAFVSVLLVFFMDTKSSFVNFIKERLSSQRSEEAVTISKKFIQFTLITGSMPASGTLILQHAIKKLSELYAAT